MEAGNSKVNRQVFVYEVPDKIAQLSGVKELGLVMLSSEEELACFRKAKNDNGKTATELAKTALVEADGKVLSIGDGSVDTFWKELHPKVRQLVMTAYTDLHSTEEEEQQSFLKSSKVRQG